jgi:hypothetical protein
MLLGKQCLVVLLLFLDTKDKHKVTLPVRLTLVILEMGGLMNYLLGLASKLNPPK